MKGAGREQQGKSGSKGSKAGTRRVTAHRNLNCLCSTQLQLPILLYRKVPTLPRALPACSSNRQPWEKLPAELRVKYFFFLEEFTG